MKKRGSLQTLSNISNIKNLVAIKQNISETMKQPDFNSSSIFQNRSLTLKYGGKHIHKVQEFKNISSNRDLQKIEIKKLENTQKQMNHSYYFDGFNMMS
jgi:hypothetical protein